MTKALRLVENLSGEKLIFIKDLNTGLDIETQTATGSAEIVKKSDIDYLKELIAELTTKLEDFIAKITEKFTTKEICLSGEDNSETCIKKEQLDELIKLLPTPSPTPTSEESLPAQAGIRPPSEVSTELTPDVSATPSASPSASPSAEAI